MKHDRVCAEGHIYQNTIRAGICSDMTNNMRQVNSPLKTISVALCTSKQGLRTSVKEDKWLVLESSTNNSNCDGIWSQPYLWDGQDTYE